MTMLYDQFKDKAQNFTRQSAIDIFKTILNPVYDRQLDDYNFRIREIEYAQKTKSPIDSSNKLADIADEDEI